MSKGDMDEKSNSISERNQTSSTAAEEKEIPLSRDDGKASDHVSVKVEPNPDNQLFQCHSSLPKKDRETNKPNEGQTYIRRNSSPTTLDVTESQTVTLGIVNKLDVLKDENSIGKGVVLNATQLYPPRDVRWVDNLGKDKTKDHELIQNYLEPGNQVTDSSVDKKEFNHIPEERKGDMSLMRKIIFGFSFLPSVLFVLCFAVILPCNEPPVCVKELWINWINASDFSTDFHLTQQALLTSFAEPNQIVTLNVETGKIMWTSSLNASIIQVECDSFDADGDGIVDCLAMTEDGFLYAYDVSNGYIHWKHTIRAENISNFVVLYPEAGNPVVAVAVSPSEIQIFNNGSSTSETELSYCSTVLSSCRTTPKRLTVWKHNNVTDLVYVCETHTDNESILRLLKQEDICANDQLKAEPLELLNSFRDKVSFTDGLLEPTPDGLVVWAEDFVAFFNNDGRELWQISVTNHSNNRYLFYGKFLPKENYIALISSDSTTYSLVTLLGASSGNETLTHFFSLVNTKNAIVLNGGDQDYILSLVKEMQEVKDNENLISSVGQTTDDIIFNLPKAAVSKYRLMLLQFQIEDGKGSLRERPIETEIVQEKQELWQPNEATRLSATVKDEILKIFMGRSLVLSSGQISVIQALQADHWNEMSGHCK